MEDTKGLLVIMVEDMVDMDTVDTGIGGMLVVSSGAGVAVVGGAANRGHTEPTVGLSCCQVIIFLYSGYKQQIHIEGINSTI